MKSVVVTGANRGIGLELCKQFLAKGNRVFATYRSDEGELKTIENTNLSTFKLDVRDADELESFVSSIEGSVDILINNAGIADGRWQSISEIDMRHAK